VKYTVATHSSRVRVSFAAKEDGEGTPSIAIEDENLIPNTNLSFTLRDGISLEEAHELAALLRKNICEVRCTVLADIDTESGGN
jgi:hypothetical protein